MSGPELLPDDERVILIDIGPPEAGTERQVTLSVPRGPESLGEPEQRGPEPTRRERPPTRPGLALPPDTVPPKPVDDVLAGVVPGFGADTATSEGEGPIGTHRLLGPAYGDGRLWVRPFEAELGVVGPASDAATHTARVDSAIRERMKAFIDSMPRDSFAIPSAPSWTTEVDGSTWGIDPNWIYLGDFKIPTALLALLPIQSGNYDQAQAARELARLRRDLIQATRRAEARDEFMDYVKELRERKERERAAERAARRDTIRPP